MKMAGATVHCLLVALVVIPAPAAAQDAQPDASPPELEATHAALRALKQEAEGAFNEIGRSGELADIEGLLDLVHDDFVLAAMNGQVVVGKAGIIDYFNATMTGPERTVQSVHHTFDVAALTTLYGGDTGVAHGTSVGTYELTNGMSFVVDTIWTATMVFENGRWLLASFQFAPSIFDNPVLNRAVNALYWVIGIVALIGLVLGFLIGRLIGKRRREAT